MQFPDHARGRLHAAARVGIVLHLGAEGDGEAIAVQRDLVLQEGGQERRGVFNRDERKPAVSLEPLVDEPVAGTGDEIVMPTDRRMVLRIDVETRPVVISNRLVPVRDVDDRLDLERRTAGTGVRPAAKEVGALCIGEPIRDRLERGRLRVEVDPQRALLARREDAFQAERAGLGGPVGAESGGDAVRLVVGARVWSDERLITAGPLREEAIACGAKGPPYRTAACVPRFRHRPGRCRARFRRWLW